MRASCLAPTGTIAFGAAKHSLKFVLLRGRETRFLYVPFRAEIHPLLLCSKINWPQTCDGCGKYESKKQWRSVKSELSET